ncbi:MAG: hypothetical protein Q8O42_07575 [Acidobacteriota bacterium]|nr:hypothetical protein [Acidobacteriota bacterium]
MTAYKNFTVDLPRRIAQLDRRVRPLATSVELEVSYLVMKMAAAFLLPYERLEGTSGARRADVTDPRSIRKTLELDKRFREASYCGDLTEWALLEVDDFQRGPRDWTSRQHGLDAAVVHKVLKTVRHSIAHSNLFFGGERKIEHIYLGSRKDRDLENGPYSVLRGTVGAVENMVDAWIDNLQRLRTSPSLIWHELEAAA